MAGLGGGRMNQAFLLLNVSTWNAVILLHPDL